MFLPGEVIPYYIQMWQKIEIACEKKRPPPSGIISGDPMSPTQVEKPSPSLLSENIKIIKTMAKSPTLHKSSPHWCHRWCTQWLGRHRLNCSRSPVHPPESQPESSLDHCFTYFVIAQPLTWPLNILQVRFFTQGWLSWSPGEDLACHCCWSWDPNPPELFGW